MPGGWKGNMEMERNRGKRHVIGLTGSMGAGKSAAAKILAGYIPVLDLDAVNAGLLEAGGAVSYTHLTLPTNSRVLVSGVGG